jgi:N-acylneuraminate cytidylyltransferase/CMP-N,N'-diacetyllegionaminic acid synthase
VLAIIPARSGSKGLPGKNIRPLAGKPLIVHTIAAALGASAITRTVCSTDSPEIATVAQKAGAEIPFLRPAELAQDNSLAIDNYIYTVDRLNAEGASIDEYCVLLPTAPLRSAADIDEAARIFRDRQADSVISYYPAPHPVQWYRYLDDAGVLRSFFDDGSRLANRQDERASYLPNGAIYIFRHAILKATRQYYTDRTYPYLMPANRSVDIDTLDDFDHAEFLLKRMTPDKAR